jgi:hypothetical protein
MLRHPDKVNLLPRLFSFLALAVVAGAAGCSRGEEPRTAEGRLSRLQAEVERQREANPKAAAEYAPQLRGRLDVMAARPPSGRR